MTLLLRQVTDPDYGLDFLSRYVGTGERAWEALR